MRSSDDHAIALIQGLLARVSRLARFIKDASPWGRSLALETAAASGDRHALAALLARRSTRRALRNFRPLWVFPNPIDAQSRALVRAADLGRSDCVELLARFPILPESLARARGFAAAAGDLPTLRALFAPGLPEPASQYFDALSFAAALGHSECLRFILSASRPTSWQIFAALGQAVANQRLECVALLLPFCDSKELEYASMAARKRGHLREAEAIGAFLLSRFELRELFEHLPPPQPSDAASRSRL